MSPYPDTSTVAEARAAYFAENGLGDDDYTAFAAWSFASIATTLVSVAISMAPLILLLALLFALV